MAARAFVEAVGDDSLRKKLREASLHQKLGCKTCSDGKIGPVQQVAMVRV